MDLVELPKVIRVDIPVRTQNPLNGHRRFYWEVTKTSKEQKALCTMVLNSWHPTPLPVELPALITLYKHTPHHGRLDPDGLAASMKYVQDSVAKWLGLDDGDLRLHWLYRTCKGKQNAPCVTVEIKQATIARVIEEAAQ